MYAKWSWRTYRTEFNALGLFLVGIVGATTCRISGICLGYRTPHPVVQADGSISPHRDTATYKKLTYTSHAFLFAAALLLAAGYWVRRDSAVVRQSARNGTSAAKAGRCLCSTAAMFVNISFGHAPQYYAGCKVNVLRRTHDFVSRGKQQSMPAGKAGGEENRTPSGTLLPANNKLWYNRVCLICVTILEGQRYQRT